MAFWNRRKPGPEKARRKGEEPAAPLMRTVEPEPEYVRPSAAPAAKDTPFVMPKRLLSYEVGNMQGVGSRQRQEDSFAFINAVDVSAMKKEGLCAIVADGMGGMRDGRIASETAIASLRWDLAAMSRKGDIPSQMKEAVLNAGAKVFEALEGDGGSTVVLCLFYDEQFYFVSVGDSYLFLLRDGALLRLNEEHNVQEREYLKTINGGSMNPAAARANEEAAALTSFLGMDEIEYIDVLKKPLKIHNGDVFLLCSDGVGGVISEEKIRECLTLGTPQEMCHAMEEAVLEKQEPYQDNYTALVVRCGY